MAETQPPDPRHDPAHAPIPSGDPPSGPPADRTRAPRRGPLLIALLVVVLIVLHQDYWLWENDYLVFGWLPIGLFHHALLSVLASLVWLLATKIAWPVETIRHAQQAASGQAASGQEAQR